MSYQWVVGIPVWGDVYVETFLRAALPAIKIAANAMSVRFIVVTDRRDRLRDAFSDCDVEFHDLPRRPHLELRKQRKHRLGDASRIIIERAEIGECIALLVADQVISRDWFTTAEKKFDQGKNIVVLYGGGRTTGAMPLAGAEACELKRWTWQHRHHWVEDCTWGRGRSLVPTILFFEKDDTVVSRGFHTHTLAGFRKLKHLKFASLGPDGGEGITNNFDVEEAAVVSSSTEMGYASMTPHSAKWPSGPPLSVERVAEWAKPQMGAWDRWLFKQRFWIVGDGDPGDREICDEILRRMQ